MNRKLVVIVVVLAVALGGTATVFAKLNAARAELAQAAERVAMAHAGTYTVERLVRVGVDCGTGETTEAEFVVPSYEKVTAKTIVDHVPPGCTIKGDAVAPLVRLSRPDDDSFARRSLGLSGAEIVALESAVDGLTVTVRAVVEKQNVYGRTLREEANFTVTKDASGAVLPVQTVATAVQMVADREARLAIPPEEPGDVIVEDTGGTPKDTATETGNAGTQGGQEQEPPKEPVTYTPPPSAADLFDGKPADEPFPWVEEGPQ